MDLVSYREIQIAQCEHKQGNSLEFAEVHSEVDHSEASSRKHDASLIESKDALLRVAQGRLNMANLQMRLPWPLNDGYI